MDKTKTLLVVTCLALAGFIVWERLPDVATIAPPAPPAPLQLTRPSAEPSAYVSAAPSVAPATSEPVAELPAVKPEKVAPKKPAPRREAVVEVPSVAASSRSNTAAPPAAPVRRAEPVAAPAAEVAHADGVKTFMVIHDHSKGNFEKDPKASCVGELVVSPTEIKFDGAGAGDSHHFEATWAEVLEAGSNKFFGSGIGGFHVTIKPDGKYQNINLAPKSKDKAEAKTIIDLVNASAKRADHTK